MVYLDKYEAAEAMKHRRRIVKDVCNEYNDVLSSVPKLTKLHNITELRNPEGKYGRRVFANSRSFTACIAYNGIVGDAILDSLKSLADSDQDSLDPCSEFDRRMKTTVPPKYEPYPHPDYPGVYIHPKRVKPTCNITTEMANMNFKLVFVKHPMERLVEAFDNHGQNVPDFKSFAEDLLNLHENGTVPPLLIPQWQNCYVCQDELLPNYIVKEEHLSPDLFYVAKVSEIDGLIKEIPKSETLESEISERAKNLFSRLDRDVKQQLFELFRADHDIYGYDPRPYLET